MYKKSNLLHKESLNTLVGGVNSPVRSFGYVDINPIFIKQGQGPFLFDEDSNCYIDMISSYGALLFGHTHPKIVSYIHENLMKGTSFGSTTEMEIKLGNYIKYFIKSIEKIRFVNSGTEATQTAIRLARGYTKKKKIIKFIGCYHGHVDSLLVKAGSGVISNNPEADSDGVNKSIIEDTIVCDFNDSKLLEKIFEKNGSDIAGIIIEPVAANMNLVLPKKEFLHNTKRLCEKYGSLLIFDEVITGFRTKGKSAQSFFDIMADITCLGKIIGGGLPVGAIGGKSEIMDNLSPLGKVYQAGTLSGNLLSVSAGYATLELINKINPYDRLEKLSSFFCEEMRLIAKKHNKPLNIEHFGSMIGIRFNSKNNIQNLSDINRHDTNMFKKFFINMLKNGVYFPPSPYEICFLSNAHTEVEIEKILKVANKTFKIL